MTNYSDRARLELLYQKTEAKSVKQLKKIPFLSHLWQNLFAALTKPQEPQIWQGYDRQGNLWWHGYDPITGRSICRDSEKEMRIWIEERYYQSAHKFP